jgi:hypothetical protein
VAEVELATAVTPVGELGPGFGFGVTVTVRTDDDRPFLLATNENVYS